MKKIFLLFLCFVIAVPFVAFADGTDAQAIIAKTDTDGVYSIKLQVDTQANGAIIFVYGLEKGNYNATASFNPEGEYKEYYVHYSEYKNSTDGTVNFDVLADIPNDVLVNTLYVTVVDTNGNIYNIENGDMPGLASASALEFVDSDGNSLGNEVKLDPGSVYSFYARVNDKYGNVFKSSNLKFELGKDAPPAVQLIDNRLTVDYKKENVNKSFKLIVGYGDIKNEVTVNVSDKYSSGEGGSGGSSSSKRSSIGGSVSVPADMIKPAENKFTSPFSDLTGSEWYYDDIIELYDRGLVKGSDGCIYPDSNISRQEICATLVRALKLTADNTVDVKSDATVSEWARESVSTAIANGIIQGDGNNVDGSRFSTREQAFVMLSRAFKLTGTGNSTSFSDESEISDWAKDSIGIMADCGYVKGDDNGNVSPKNPITRAEFFAVILRMMNSTNN